MSCQKPDIRQLAAERILLLDGAMGTMIQRLGLDEADFRGERFADHPQSLQGNNDLLSLTQPQAIAGIHREYLKAGSSSKLFSVARIFHYGRPRGSIRAPRRQGRRWRSLKLYEARPVKSKV